MSVVLPLSSSSPIPSLRSVKQIPIPENLSPFGILVFGPLSSFEKSNLPLGKRRFSKLDSALKSQPPERDLFSEVGIR